MPSMNNHHTGDLGTNMIHHKGFVIVRCPPEFYEFRDFLLQFLPSVFHTCESGNQGNEVGHQP